MPDEDLRATCRDRAAVQYGMPPGSLDLAAQIVSVAGGGFELPGAVDKPGEGRKTFLCKFSGDRRLVDVMATTPDGE